MSRQKVMAPSIEFCYTLSDTCAFQVSFRTDLNTCNNVVLLQAGPARRRNGTQNNATHPPLNTFVYRSVSENC
eukprot:6016327-Amphidinium_carterae.1